MPAGSRRGEGLQLGFLQIDGTQAADVEIPSPTPEPAQADASPPIDTEKPIVEQVEQDVVKHPLKSSGVMKWTSLFNGKNLDGWKNTEFGGEEVPEPEVYLEKPVEPEELAEVIKKFLD